MIIDVFSKALRNLLLPGILKIFLMCLLAYLVGWTILAWVLSALISSYVAASASNGFFIHVLGSVGGMIIAWFLFPLLYPILINFFDDNMASVIEAEDYPALPKAQPPFWPTILHDIIFSLKAVGLNLICIPLYFIPVVNVVVYYLLNGHLLGTQFFNMAAGRRTDGLQASVLRKKARMSILLIGIAISFSSTIPILNLAAPLLGVATMLHLFHALNGNKYQEQFLPR